jgi:hypothetical protein
MTNQSTLVGHPDDYRVRTEALPVTQSQPGEAAHTERPPTRLGVYLHQKSVNKAIVARKTGLSKQRMGELTLNPDARLRATEVYVIALAIGVSPCELFEYVCEGLTLKENG